MSLRNLPVVWAGRLGKCLDVDGGVATICWIDRHDRLVVREVPAAECIRFSDAVRPRSLWPDSAMAPDDLQDERRARRNRQRLAA